MTKYLGSHLKAIIILSLVFVVQLCQAQVQKGIDIDGEFDQDFSGFSVSMPDENTVAIGAVNNDGNGNASGQVRIYAWDGNTWIQKGLDIDGETAGDNCGNSLCMPDPNTIAIGSIFSDSNGPDAGQVRVFLWNGFSWLQKGANIPGNAINDNAGFSLSMPDSNTVAVGAPFNDGIGSSQGQVRIFKWNGNSWLQKGMDISGESNYSLSGWAISMPDTNTIAIGAPYNNGNGVSSGSVRIYTWNGTMWIKKGSDIDGEAADDLSGNSVSMSDSNTVAIGAHLNDGNGINAGHVRIYRWDGTYWIQKGVDIDGEFADDFTGCVVSMPDSNIVAISVHLNDANGLNAGQVRIYGWNETDWIQKGVDINGEAANDWFGSELCMPDSNTIAIGAPFNDGNGNNAGHVRVFSLNSTVSVSNIKSELPIKIYPNPTKEDITLDIQKFYSDITVNISNALGKVISSDKFTQESKVKINLPGTAGIYFIELILDRNRFYFKAIKE